MHRYTTRKDEYPIGPTVRAFLRACPIEAEEAFARFGKAVHEATYLEYATDLLDEDGYSVRPCVLVVTPKGLAWIASGETI